MSLRMISSRGRSCSSFFAGWYAIGNGRSADEDHPRPRKQPMNLPRLIQWNVLDFKISGERIARIIGEEIEKRKAPVSELELEFADDLFRIDGKIKKAIAIPFTIEILSFHVEGTVLRVPLHRAAAFGIPIPSFLMTIAQFWLPAADLSYDSAAKTILVKLDRFLPPFVDVKIEQIRPVSGGIAVRLGPGGADPPL
jgi:hypothetical protein